MQRAPLWLRLGFLIVAITLLLSSGASAGKIEPCPPVPTPTSVSIP